MLAESERGCGNRATELKLATSALPDRYIIMDGDFRRRSGWELCNRSVDFGQDILREHRLEYTCCVDTKSSDHPDPRRATPILGVWSPLNL